MKHKALIIPIAVAAAGVALMVVGIMRADAAVPASGPSASSSSTPADATPADAAQADAAQAVPSPPATASRSTTSSPSVTSPSPSASPTRPPSPAASAAAVDENCAAGAALGAGKYWINNNQWGKDSGSGSQCMWQTGRSGGTLSWGTRWRWTGQSNSVKAYGSAVLGWHWGFKAAGTGLPIHLSDHKAVRTTWNFTVTQQTVNTMNVSYDLWLHDLANADWMDQPTDEVMVWLYRSGGAGPLGTKQATVTIGGTTWDLYRGNIGWNVFSFVRTASTTSSALDLTDFTDDLTARGWLPRTKYLSSVEAGTEVFTGEGRLDTSAYSVTID